MRERFLKILAALLTTLAPLSAYIQNQRFSGALLVRDDFTAIPYRVDDRTAPGLHNSLGGFTITPASDPLAAIQAAMNSWTQAGPSRVAFGPFALSSGLGARNDGVNLITFADTPENRSLVGDAVAVTFLFSRSSGVLTDTDILFNPRLRFSTQLDSTAFDIQGTLAHELGHALGLDHSGVAGATMFALTTQGTQRTATLSADDVAFVRDVYPLPEAAGQFGELRGRVSQALGTAAVAVHVAAVDPEQSLVIGGITGLDGSYRIAGLPPGNYWVYAEPLDGPALSSQLGVVRPQVHVHTNFFGGLLTPQRVAIGPGAMATADLSVESGSAGINIQGAGAAPVGQLITSRLTAAVQPGGVHRMELHGQGLDAAEISEGSISLLGGDLRIIPGSLSRNTLTFSDGSSFPRLSFEVEVGAGVPAGLATVVVSRGAAVAALTGGIAVLEAAPSPVFSSNGVTNAASFLTGPLVPGEIVSIFGENLGPGEGLVGGTDVSGLLVKSLGGVEVTFNGLPAPLFFVGRNQINLQAPFELDGAPNAVVRIRRGTTVSGPVLMTLGPAHPGIFTHPASARAMALNQDGTLNGPSNPARRGAFISIFGTGLGSISPFLASGQLAAIAEPLNRAVQPVSVNISGLPAQVSFAGMAPALAGVLQVNALIPADSTTGPQVLIDLIVAGIATGQTATVAVD